jgi:Cu(I)/Ag(I) efflux system membrane fusion protein
MSADNERAMDGPGESPFGRPARGRRRILRIGAGVALLAVAVLVVFLLSRETGNAAATSEHDNMTMPAVDTAAGPVMIDAEAARRIGVTFAPVTSGPLVREVRAVGLVTVDETRMKSVSPKIDGWIEQLYVNYTGQFVRRGDPLFSIYSPMLVTSQEELVLAKRLASDVAGGTPEAARGAADLLASARRRLLYWDVPESVVARIEATGEVTKTLTLRAPVDGYVVEKSVIGGQQIMSGTSVYTIADLSVVWIEGEVFEQDVGSVKLGERVSVEIQTYPGERFFGRIAYINPMVSSESRTVRVRVEMANPNLRLKPGMYATIRISGAEGAAVLSVPRSAVVETGTRVLVFVKRADGMLEPRDVTLGAANDARVSILDGLALGDTVVASATFLIDAESNLKSALDAMANMPGMGAPKASDRPATKEMPGMKMDTVGSGKKPARPKSGGEADHSDHRK